MRRARVPALVLWAAAGLLLLGFTTPSAPARHPTSTGDISKEGIYVYDPNAAGSGLNVIAKTPGASGCTNLQALNFYNDAGTSSFNCLDVANAGPTGAWESEFLGLVIESTNGEGAFAATGSGTSNMKFRNIVCTCRVTGTGGTNGIFVELFAGGVAGANCELNGGDANACDDTAGTVMKCDINTAIVLGTNYTLQFKSTTDCASNPTDCGCNVVLER